MIKKTVILNFPRSLTTEPITYKLVKEFDINFNILKARIKPNEEGLLIIQIKGSKDNLDKSMQYLDDIGINWKLLSNEITWDNKVCVHCTACISHCPTDALNIDRSNMYVNFDHDKCIACERCLDVCSYKAISFGDLK
ncbi:MAG: NIL domain-containing protein [Cyanobacteriota bacterium]